MPYHTAYKHLPKFDIPVAEKLVKHILSIPNQDDMTFEEVEYVAKCIIDFYKFN